MIFSLHATYSPLNGTMSDLKWSIDGFNVIDVIRHDSRSQYIVNLAMYRP